MTEINVGAMMSCLWSSKKLRNPMLASEEGGCQPWKSGGEKKLMTCCVRIEKDTSFQLETLKTSLFRNCQANSMAGIAVLM